MKYLKFLVALAIYLPIHTAYAQNRYTAHEWGTFTSVINKEGQQIQGLHHEEEALPSFVFDLSRRDGTMIRAPFPSDLITKGFTPQAMNLMPIPTFTERITQKMETPVIYFYSNQKLKVSVKVDFPNGVISQWFPDVTQVNPSTEAKNGHASWDINVLNETRGSLPTTSANSIWNPSREVRSNIIETKNQREKLIFYRGLGDFDTPLSIKFLKQQILLENKSAQDIHGLVILNDRESKHEYLSIDTLPAHSKVTVSLKKYNTSLKSYSKHSKYLAAAKSEIVEHLNRSGLYEDESIAMVNTWEKGYFTTKGLRVLYVLPRAWTEEILPIQLTPVPTNLVRTLIGRVEVLTDEDDRSISAFIENYIKNDSLTFLNINGKMIQGLGHFPEPKLRRALQLESNPEVRAKISNLITKMNQTQQN